MKPLFKKTLILAMCIAVLTAAGCWNKLEPKELAAIHSIIYDIDDNGEFILTAEILDHAGTAGGNGGGEIAPNLIAEGKGKSAREALADISKSVEKEVFAGHNKVRLFTERLAKSEAVNILDFLLRSHLTDEESIIIVIKGETPEEIFYCSTGLSDLVGDYFELLSTTQRNHTSKAVFVTTLDFLKDHLCAGKQPVAGVAEITEKPKGPPQSDTKGQQEGGSQQGTEKKIILYEGLAAFKDDKLAGFFNGDEARAYNILTNDLGVSVVSIPSKDGLTGYKICTSKSDVKASVNGDTISFIVNIKMTTDIVEESGNIDVSKAQWLKILEKDFDERMQRQISDAIKKAQQEFASDIFGFGSALHMQLPDKWRELKDNWDEHFAKAAVYVTVESTITRTGQIKGPSKFGEEQ